MRSKGTLTRKRFEDLYNAARNENEYSVSDAKSIEGFSNINSVNTIGKSNEQSGMTFKSMYSSNSKPVNKYSLDETEERCQKQSIQTCNNETSLKNKCDSSTQTISTGNIISLELYPY